MEFTAQQIAQLLNGIVEGNENASVNNLSKLEEGAPNTLSFLSNPKYTPYIYTTNASIVIVNKTLQLESPVKTTCTLIRVDNAYEAFAKLLELYNQLNVTKTGIEQPSFISTNATIGFDCYVGAFAYIGANVKINDNVKIYPHVYIGDNCIIGNNTIIFPGVKIYHNCVVGNNCIIHASTVIGADGFGFAPTVFGETFAKVPQIGNVVIEDYVEIGSNTCIDRATLGSTILRRGVKLDNLVQIAHNVEVGENTYFAAGGVVAGSTKIGKNCMFSGQVGIVGHLNIADNTIISAQSGISKSVTHSGEVYMGSPAFEASKYRKAYVHFRNLDSLAQRVNKIEKQQNDNNKS